MIVEPKGAVYLDPLGGGELNSGWMAAIQAPGRADFREFAIIYHEIGHERYRHLDTNDRPVTQVDPFTGAYRPGDRAVNYRSEPFMNRLQLQQERFGHFDESLAYSSYAFGDPATPIMRSYLGDPTKQRLLHGGSEVFHVHHVHGGATRWPRQPQAERAAGSDHFDDGLVKHPPILPAASERTDSQSLGPAETFDIENECGSGGCQQSVGDYLFHCHIAHHYFAGMWGIWRVYNTLQDGLVSQDSLPPLAELPDRKQQVQPAVTSEQLTGSSASWNGTAFTITLDNLASWVERQLPPAGVPRDYDAAVWDWQRQEQLYLGEPPTVELWPGYQPPRFTGTPAARRPIYFDPQTGKPAYPLLQPHLGRRPPFAPGHGPAPYLDPIQQGPDPPAPGASGPGSLCPAGTRTKQFQIHAITLPIALNTGHDLVDPSGAIFVLKSQEDQVRKDNELKTPLAIRANAGEDCIDVIFKSELEDNRENRFFSKVSLHIHFVQFDVQASDGTTAGFNYEQTLRPFSIEGETLLESVAAGSTRLRLSGTERFQPGVLVGVGMDQDATFEVRRVDTLESDPGGNQWLILSEPLAYDHAAGEITSVEFLRQRWYPDVQFGTAYFHDHVNALVSWRHGLFGALIAEPPGSTYHHPHSGESIESGPIADVHTDAPVAADVAGSFRELVLFLQDDNALTRSRNSSGGSLNLRAEPLALRAEAAPEHPEQIFSSQVHGDPATPLLQAYVGDPLVIRGLVAGTNDMHTLHVDGHWFRIEPFSRSSPPVNTVHLGISERYDLVIPRAGGPQQMPGDYLYYNGRTSKLEEGSWGLLRVFGRDDPSTLQKLRGHEVTAPAAGQICPPDATRKTFDVAVVAAQLPMLRNERGLIYVLRQDVDAVGIGGKPVEPLVLHANIGDCVVVHLTNLAAEGPVSFHADLLAADPMTSLGVEAGHNPAQAALPGQTGIYTYYAHPELGEIVALVRDWGNVRQNPRRGLYGAIVIGPAGATYTDPVTGADMAARAGWRVDVHPPNAPSYRDFTLLLQDEDPVIGTHIMPYSEQVSGVVGINYMRAAEPAHAAGATGAAAPGPATPRLEAYTGDPLRIHVLAPCNEQSHVFALEGHAWRQEPRPGAGLLSAVKIGALEAVTIIPTGGAGAPGDYQYGDQRLPYREAGLWGLLRVFAAAPDHAGLRVLPQ